MKASLRALLSAVIDYAGLFPPASLSLDESIRRYADHRATPEAWMLSRFICPSTRLTELLPYLDELFTDGEPLSIAALGRSGASVPSFTDGFAQDLLAITEFHRGARRRATVEVLETRLPPEADKSLDLDPQGMTLFFEASVGEDWRGSIQSCLEFIRGTAHGAGFKLRTGGVEASAFPRSEQIAFTLVACRKNKVPLKFTAGLHHPIRHFNPSVNATMHGFINVLTAGVLANAAGLGENELTEILEDEDARNFAFDDAILQWKDFRATIAQIKAARQHHVISFGSCSFDEPRDDLRAMGWL